MEMVMSPSVAKIAPALLAAQSEMSNPIKGSSNPFFKSSYASLNSVREASHTELNKNGITVLQPMVQKDGKSYVRTLLLHVSGEFLGSDTEVVAAKQNDPQAYGSATSYARRYGLQALLSLGADDDDGEATMERSPAKAPQKAAPLKASEVPKPVLPPVANTVALASVPASTPSPQATPVAQAPKPSFKKSTPVAAKPAMNDGGLG